jgi:hypothetical protein
MSSGRQEDQNTRQPWGNRFIESFNARLRDELLNGEIFYTMKEARIVIESWRRHYNTVRPHFIVELQTAGPGGPAMAGCATWTSFADHPVVATKAGDALTSNLDHLMGSGQRDRHQASTG